jgi:hypothetical protein
VENGTAISNNLTTNQVDQWFETPKTKFQIEQKRPGIKEKLTNHRTPHATMILCEVQIGET